jgi:hypothetical protein
MILADNAPLNKNQCHAVSMYLVAGKLTAPLCNHFFFVLVSSLNMYPLWPGELNIYSFDPFFKIK